MQSSDPNSRTFAFDARHQEADGAEVVLDRATFSALEELAGEDDPGLVADLVDLFLEDSFTRMNLIDGAASSGDNDTIGRAAHALKSSSANIGALEFSRVCAQLESGARDASTDGFDEIESLVARASRMYMDVREALNAAPTSTD